MINRKFIFLLMVPIFILALVTSSCDSGGDGGSSTGGTVQKDTAIIEGTVAEVVVASAKADKDSNFLAIFKSFLKFTKIAKAQEEILAGIFVEAFDTETDPDMNNPIASDTTDENGGFRLEEVPCNTPLKLVFTYEDLVVEIVGIILSCDGETDVLIMTFSLNFDEGSGNVDDVDEQEELSDAQLSCLGGEQEQLIDSDFEIDGEGGPCIIAAGNCELEIIAASVRLLNCSSCVEARGNSNIEILTTQFECEASEDGIRAVGNSELDVEVIAGEMMDDTPVPSDMQRLIQLFKDDTISGSGNGNILIVAGEDGIDLRGNTSAELESSLHDGDDEDEDGDDDDDNDESEDGNDDDDSSDGDDDDDTKLFVKDHEGANITIEGGENGIIAVGNSEAEIKGKSCTIEPTTITKGNAEVEVECGQDEDGD